ncbi:hypothetical protein OC842_006946 [Tilletia horrida]|uniref:Uncharacterized protein n=1 Tax=Tilletia horrida TaxID=155126 RepID=A0AAN6JH57_9BASI|nr:hypothetical protein OC842_006946 [Tilletia horrida]
MDPPADLTDPAPASPGVPVPRNSILLKHSSKPSLTHLEWYELHNGVPLALRIPAPVSQKQKEREKQLERDAREREREKELEREREKERAERNKLEERIWGIPKKALLLGLPEVNFNAQMAMLGGWGNGSGGPTASSTPSTPSKAFLKEREREKVRQREREKQREAEEAQERLDPEELAALNAIINTRRSMAAAQALASGQVVPPRPRRISMNASTVTTPRSAPLASSDGMHLHERSLSRASEPALESSGQPSTSRYNRSHQDSITSSTVSLKSSATATSTGTGPSQSVAADSEPSASSPGEQSTQSPNPLRYVPRIRFAPLPLPPPVDRSPPLGNGPAVDDDRASSIEEEQGQGLESDTRDTADIHTPKAVDQMDDSTAGFGAPSTIANFEGTAAESTGSASRNLARSDSDLCQEGLPLPDPSGAAASDHASTEGRRSATGTYLAGGAGGSGTSTMRQSFESLHGAGAGLSRMSSALALGISSTTPSALSSGPSPTGTSASRKRPRFPRVDSEDSSRAGSTASGIVGDSSDREEMDEDTDEGWRKRLSANGKGKWYLMGMPTHVFKSMRRPGTADSSKRRAALDDVVEGKESSSSKLTRRLSTGGVASPSELVRKSGTNVPGTVSSASSTGSPASSPVTGPSITSTSIVGSLGSQSSTGAGIMSFFGRSDGDADERERGRPSLVARNSSSRTSSRSRRRSGSRGSARSREREKEVDYYTDEEERARRRKLVRSVRPGGTGMVTLPDGTKIPARRVDSVANEDRTGAGPTSGASAFDEEFDFSQWGFAGLARRSAGLNTATVTTMGSVATGTAGDTITDSDQAASAIPRETSAADVIAARMEKKSAAGSAEEVKRKYAEAEARRASTAAAQSTPHQRTSGDETRTSGDGSRDGPPGLVLQTRRASVSSTVGAHSEPRAGLSDGEGDKTITPHSTPKAHGSGSALAPLTALTPIPSAPRSPGLTSRSAMPGNIAPAKTTTAASDAAAVASGAFANAGISGKNAAAGASVSNGAQWPVVSSKTSTPGLGLTLERAEIIRRRHEAEVAALGAEILANVKGPRRKTSADELLVSGAKDGSNDKEMARTSTMGSGKDGAVLSKSKHERVGSIFNKDKHKAAITSNLPTVPGSPGESHRSKNKSDPPRGRRLEGGHGVRESRSNSLAMQVEGSPASVKRAGQSLSTDATPMPSPALGHDVALKTPQKELHRGDLTSPIEIPGTSAMVTSTSAPQVSDVSADSTATQSNASFTSSLSLGKQTSNTRSARGARSPSGRRINVDPRISMPAPLDWLPRRPDARGHQVVPLPQLGIRPRRPREGRVWDGWGYFSDSDGEGEEINNTKAAKKPAYDSDSDSESDDDLDPETIAAEDRKTKFQQSRLTTKAAGQEIVHSRANSSTGRRDLRIEGKEPARSGRRASAGHVLSLAPPSKSTHPVLRSASSARSLGRSEALNIPQQPRHVSSASSMRGASRSLSQSPSNTRPPAPSTVARDDDSDDAEFWSPNALQTMTNSSLPATKFSDTPASASVRSRSARDKRLREKKSREPERNDSLNIDYGWSAAHHPSLFDNRK